LNTYECMYITQANLSDEENERVNRRIVEEIEKRGGSILDRERLGKKRLAYSIRKQDDGVYTLMYFQLPPGQVTSLRTAYRLHPRLLRYLILRKEAEDVPRLQKRAEAPQAESEAAPAEWSHEEKAPAGDEETAQKDTEELGDEPEPDAEAGEQE
jgi:small subunit ribosomal protein S6